MIRSGRASRALLLFAALSCDSGPTEPPVPVALVEVSGAPAEGILLVGATSQLSAVPRDAGGAALTRRITWASSDIAVARVSANGLVTALAPGVVLVTAEADGEIGAIALSIRVSVPVPSAAAPAPVTTALLGNSLQLTLPPGATTVPTLTVGRAAIVTNDTRILTQTAFVIGPIGAVFTTPATAEVAVNLTAIPPARRAGLRLYRVDALGNLEAVLASAPDLTRGVVVATLTRTGTYVVIVPGDPALLFDLEGTSRRVEIGTAVPGIGVIARDAAGNPVPGASVVFSVVGGSGQVLGDSIAVTNTEGEATIPGEWVVGPAKGNYQLRARVVGTTLSVLFQATAFAPAVAVEILSAPTAGLSGLALSEPTIVRLRDTFGDQAEVTQDVSLALIGGSGTLDGTTTSLAVLGGVIFQGQRIIGAGTYRIVASSAGLAPDTTAEIVITQALASLAILTQPAGAQSGLPFTTQPVLELRDHAGARLAGGTAVVTADGHGVGTLFGTRSVAAVDGIVTFTDLAIEGVGSTQINFLGSSPSGPLNVMSSELTVAPAPPGIRLLVGGGPVRNANVGQLFGVTASMDLSNRGGANLVEIDVTLQWDPARFAYFGNSNAPWRDSENVEAVITVDVSQVASGSIRFTGTSTNATLASFSAGLLLLETLATASPVESTITAIVHKATSSAATPVPITILPMRVSIYPQP